MADASDPTSGAYDDHYASPYVLPLTIGNAAKADQYEAEYRARDAELTKQRLDAEQAQSMNVEKMSKVLDDTAARVRESKSGGSNLPLMAMGAAMATSPGGIGQQIGAGFKAMVPAIQQQREDDQATELKLGGLELQKGQLQNMSLTDRLKYIQALQTGNLGAMKAIEQAQIRSQPTAVQQANLDAKKVAQDAKDAAQKAKEDKEAKTLRLNLINEATKAARDNYNAAIKDNEYSADEANDLHDTLLRRELESRSKGAGIDLQADMNQILADNRPANAGTARNFFPTDQQMSDEAAAANLPAKNPGVYSGMGTKDKTATRKQQQAQFDSHTKSWQSDVESDSAMREDLKTAQDILQRHPDLVGPVNSWGPNYSRDAARLNEIYKKLQARDIPKGQGQVSNSERELFAQGMLNEKIPASAARDIINQRLNVMDRSSDYRDFNEEYFRVYKTMRGADTAWDRYVRSPQGSAMMRDDQGRLVPNNNRMDWRTFFKNERENPNPPPTSAEQTGQTHGGGIPEVGKPARGADGKPIAAGSIARSRSGGPTLKVDANGVWVRAE